jgi:hypothetical protein
MKAKAVQTRRGSVASAKNGSEDLEICLRLYVASWTPNSQRAEANLDAALREFTESTRYRVEIIDVLADGKRAITDSVIVTPTLFALGPKRRLVMVGDLSDPGKLRGLLKAAASLG